MERVAGIEPDRSAWEANRLPLHHTRQCHCCFSPFKSIALNITGIFTEFMTYFQFAVV